MAEVRVASVGEIGEGEVKGFEVEGTAVGIAKAGGDLRAFHNECTHMHCSMEDGDVEDGNIVCPCHHSAFSLETGEVTSPPANEPIRVYPVRIDGDDVFVTLE